MTGNFLCGRNHRPKPYKLFMRSFSRGKGNLAVIDGWLAPGKGIEFEQGDFDVLDLVLSLQPELRICALAVKRARTAGITYPIETVEVLSNLVGEGFSGAGHRISIEDVPYFIPQVYLPIEHEGELVSRVYLGLIRCREEISLASRVNPGALSALHQVLETQ
jgi:hypothetical protein